MILDTFKVIKRTPDVDFTVSELGNNVGGVFLAEPHEVIEVLPYMKALMDTFPYDINEYLFDVKVHMLMDGQYPCIPNWHCDFVPRDSDGRTCYEKTTDSHTMLLWLSNSPTTEFLAHPVEGDIQSHRDLTDLHENAQVQSAPAKTWISMGSRTPHRGTQSKQRCWRVFVRAIHKSTGIVRPDGISLARKHVQVYLDPLTFTW